MGEEDLRYSYDAIKKGQQPDVLLQPNDIIEVRTNGPWSAKGFSEMLLGATKGMIGLAPQRAILY